ncbi:MAG: TetR/AcrR family transcriptional regulator [Prevotellaceae bacterium]|jgi:AcrR family transcriptional regulator|nr:TetR/AcrR family transcriptional regulator [Prevotellaceae bacterium]
MNKNELNTEQIILEAAETEFLEKGYGNAKMVAIAKRANVSHSMLHYYFRTKEKLFQMIFRKKMQNLLQPLGVIFDKNLPFEQTIRQIIETQFNFVAKQPRLPLFIFNEILSNKTNRELVFEFLVPHFTIFLNKVENLLNAEIEKGNIRPISLKDFIMNIISINISIFIAMPIIQDIFQTNDRKTIEKILKERRESNIQFILNALRP